MGVYMRYFFIYLFTIWFTQSTFVKASGFDSDELNPVRKIILSYLPQTPEGLKGFLSYRQVCRKFRVEASNHSLWMRFLPVLGLSPNIDRAGNFLFTPPHAPAEKWTVSHTLVYLIPMLGFTFEKDTNTNSYPCQWACCRLVQLFEKEDYKKLIPEDKRPSISLVAKALLVARSAVRDPMLKQSLERFSITAVFDDCPDLHNLRVALMLPLINDILLRIKDYENRVVRIGVALRGPPEFCANELEFSERKKKRYRVATPRRWRTC